MSQSPLLRVYDEIATFFARGPSPEEILAFQFSEETVDRLRDLLDKNSAGTLTEDEADGLDQVGQVNRMLLLIRSRIARGGAQSR